MRARTVGIATMFALLVIGVLCWVMVRREPDVEPPPRGPRPSAPAPEPQAKESDEIAVPAAEPKPAVAAAETSPEPTLHGTLLFLDPDGAEHDGVDASFALVLWRGDRGQHSPKIEAKKGRWNSSLTRADLEGAKLGVTGLVAGDRTAFFDPDARLDAPDDLALELELEARWLESVSLKVVGEDTRADLTEVTVVRTKDWSSDRLNHPGAFAEDSVLAKAAPSPVDLALPANDARSLSRSFTVWASAPGYAWGRIEIDFTAGGERLLVLPRGGALRVTLRNFQEPGAEEAAAILRVRREPEPPAPAAKSATAKLAEALLNVKDEDIPPGMTRDDFKKLLEPDRSPRGPGVGSPSAEAVLGSASPIVIDGLAPGRYLVRAEIGDWFRNPVVLAAEPVEIVAGERTEVTLELEDRPRPGAKVPLEGTLVFPVEWPERRISIEFETMDRPRASTRERVTVPWDELAPVDGKPGLHRWSVGRVVPGKYLATIRAFELQTILEVGPAGLTDALIEIGPPAEIEVRVVDAGSGAPIEFDGFHWSCRRPAGSRAGGMNGARSDGAGVFSFQAPAGEIELGGTPLGYEWIHERVTAVAGRTNTFELKLKRTCGLIVSVREGEQVLPYNVIEHAIEVVEQTEKGRVQGWSGSAKGRRLTLSAPGTYDVRVKKLPGYQPVEPVTVEIVPGQFVEHVVELRREQ